MCNHRAEHVQARSDEIMDTLHRGYCTFVFDSVWKHCGHNSHSATHSSLLAGASGATRSGGDT